MKCAYCGKDGKGTREHIISCAILDLFPECFLTFDSQRNAVYEADPMIKDVCPICNNMRLSYIDSYAKDFISRYFVDNYTDESQVEIDYNYALIQKMLLKYAFNDMRAKKEDCSFFDEELRHYLLNEDDTVPKPNISVLCGLAVNVSPAPDMLFGNLKLRWGKNPIFYANSVVQNISHDTGDIIFNDSIEVEDFKDLRLSYIFRFNSVQFLLMCWDKKSENINQNNIILSYQYPYHLLKADESHARLPICTDEFNYHKFEHIHVRWDGLFEVGTMRKIASGGYACKNLMDQEWAKEENRIKEKHPRGKK